MPSTRKWKSVTAGIETKHRSENATYAHLREWATQQPDGTRVEVYVQEPGSERWYTFEKHVVRSGLIYES